LYNERTQREQLKASWSERERERRETGREREPMCPL